MYKAIYSYESHDSNILSFQPGTEFNLIEPIDEHWWSMHDGVRSGLVPASYLEVNYISEKGVLQSLDTSIEHIRREIRQSGPNEKERRNLQRLVNNKELIEAGNSLWSTSTEIPQQPKRQAPKVPQLSTTRGKSTKRHSAPLPPTVSSPNYTQKSPSISEGAASRIYNIQVNDGDISPLRVDALNNPPYNISSNKTSPHTISIEYLSSASPIQQVKGHNMTITKTNNGLSINAAPLNLTANNQNSTTINKTSLPNNNNENLNSALDNCRIASSHSESSLTKSNSSTNMVTSSTFKSEHSKTNVKINIRNELGKDLVDGVRARCKVNFNKSLAAVRYVLHTVAKELPDIGDVIGQIEKQIQDDNLKVYRGSLAIEDASRLYNVLDQLVVHKEDSQQRNWAVADDFNSIKDLLDEVISVMDDVDPSICGSVLQEDEYHYLNDLVVYYQMEPRVKLRISLLHVFGCFCQLGVDFISQILCSVLPTELASDMMQDQKEVLKFLSSSLMLTMIFSTGEPVPYHHYVQFNDNFIEFILNTIEDPPDNDIDDQVSDSLVGMLLAFNQHFKAPKHNAIMHVLSKRHVCRTLSEKIMLLINREEDPVALFEFSHSCPDSVLKFLIDVFASKETSDMFFTNDLYVLIDIILRQFTNRSEKDKVRTEYLSLFHSMMNTTNYEEHKRSSLQFKRCFADILNNAENESEVDIYIVKEIITRFSHLFS